MIFRCFLILLIALIALAGCEKAQREIIDTVTSEASNPVKVVSFVDYTEGGKDAYIEWIASVAETLQAPEELLRIRSYDNLDPEMSPHRLAEWEFNSFLDAETYFNRPEITEILKVGENLISKPTLYTFIQDVDRSHTKEEGDWQIKHVFLIDYVPGGKQAYLESATEIATAVISPTQLKAVASYDNYYGETPHRLVEFEFATQEDAAAYDALEEVMQSDASHLERSEGKWSQVMYRFQMRPDYIQD